VNTLRSFVSRHSLIVFFVLTAVLSWFLMIWDPHSINAYGPLVSALVLLGIISGWSGVRDFLRRIVQWRVGVQWYVVVLGLPVVIAVATVALGRLLGAEIVPPQAMPPVGDTIATVLFILLYIGLGEEPAWRGFALPRLMVGRTALAATLILGVFHASWHLPLAGVEYDWQNVVPWFMLVMSGAVVFTWVYQNTRGTLLLPILQHTSVNVSAKYLFFPSFGEADILLAWWLLAGLWFVVAVTLVLVMGPNLVRRNAPASAIPYAGEPITVK
jgi:membrane protease YdiL (CAAX protease family)